MVQFLAYFILSFNTPILNTHLDKLGYTPKFISATITMVACAYALSIPVVQVCTRFMNKRGILLLGFITVIIGTLSTGLSDEEQWHHTSYFVLTGTAIFGIGFSMITIPVMPEILEGIEEREDLIEQMDENTLYNNLAGYFVVCQAFGESAGPALSSTLYIRLDLVSTQRILALAVFIFLILYLLFCDAASFFVSPKH